MNFYPKKISESFQKPQNAGKAENANAVGTNATFVCGAVLRLTLRINVETKEILEAKFKTSGCGFLIASADALTQKILGRKLTELHGLEKGNLQSEIESELEKFAAGTALAIALRRDELTLRPVHVGSGLELVVLPYVRGEEAWPLGWKAEETPRQLVPKLYESLTIEIDGFTLDTALTALEPRLTLPVVMDEWVLDELKINPEKIPVKLPTKKTFLKSAVDRLLAQARLAGEVRIDDAGMAFLWVTQFGADSRPAK